MRNFVKTTLTRATALAGISAAVLAVVSPISAAAQTAPRVGTARRADAAAQMPGADLLAGLRRQAASPVAKTPTVTLNAPYGLAVDASSHVYVTNIFGGVNVYDTHLKQTGAITAGISYPVAVGIAFDATIYVANNGASNVTVYNASLAQIGTITDPAMSNPSSIFIDTEDNAWVLDTAGSLHGYLKDGTVLTPNHTGGTVVVPGDPITVWGHHQREWQL